MAEDPQITEVAPGTTAVVREVVPMDELAGFFDRSFPAIGAALGAQGIAPTGPAFALYRSIADGRADLEVGFPTAEPIQPGGGVEAGSIPGGPAARLVHEGAYDHLASSWERLRTWMTEQDHEPGSPFVEVYVTEPTPEMDPADLRTELIWLLA